MKVKKMATLQSKKTVVIHSGGMDSSLCLALAKAKWGNESVLSLSFDYGQRNHLELEKAAKICSDWKIDHQVTAINFYSQLTSNALLDPTLTIKQDKGSPPNTLVLGRNGLFARLGAIVAYERSATSIYMGVIQSEGANPGYRDCSRHYMNLMESVLKLDLGDPDFQILTPLIQMTKKETLLLAKDLRLLDYLLENTLSCYEGMDGKGCEKCSACLLRNEGIAQFKETF